MSWYVKKDKLARLKSEQDPIQILHELNKLSNRQCAINFYSLQGLRSVQAWQRQIEEDDSYEKFDVLISMKMHLTETKHHIDIDDRYMRRQPGTYNYVFQCPEGNNFVIVLKEENQELILGNHYQVTGRIKRKLQYSWFSLLVDRLAPS
ncbi:hypothetical protein [Paenibacillus taichungensis]|uniref:hypothetical protein n=1 Tax=Paenibacillus taichungensis TaxID=484184 RepID=UPI0035DD0EB3